MVWNGGNVFIEPPNGVPNYINCVQILSLSFQWLHFHSKIATFAPQKAN
jgi:hypothetical protein